MCFKKNRTTVLLGAGSVLELKSLDNNKSTTGNITKFILDNKPEYYDPAVKSRTTTDLINNIYERICNSYHPSPIPYNDNNSFSKVHFEIIFYILECLETFERSWQHSTATVHTNWFAPFVKKDFQYNKNDLYVCRNHIIDCIIRSVRKYNDIFKKPENDWYRIFWQIKNSQWDIFNLNYDTTIEESLGIYEDGFESIPDQEEFQRFSVKKLFSNSRRLSTVNHIHGCLTYGSDRYNDINHDVYDFQHQDMYKWPNLDKSYDIFRGTSSSYNSAQDGSIIIQGPIITGLHKTDKVTCLPYDAYRHNFFKCITQNHGLLISGYSFGDNYINNMFYRMYQAHGLKTRVVLIEFWDIASFVQKHEADDPKANVLDSDLSPRIFNRYFTIERCNDNELLFIKRISHIDCDVWKHFNKLSLSGPMISDNGMLMLFIGGFRNAIEKHRNEIINFLY